MGAAALALAAYWGHPAMYALLRLGAAASPAPVPARRWSRSVLTGALGVVALPALGPGPSALGAAVGRRRALPAALLGAIGAGHRALAPRAPLLPLSVHCRRGHKRDGHSRVTTGAGQVTAAAQAGPSLVSYGNQKQRPTL